MKSDLELCQEFSECCAENISWMIGAIRIADGTLTVSGWAILRGGTFEEATFMINGVNFPIVKYPIASPAVAEHFYKIRNAAQAHFECSIACEDIPAGRYYRLEFVQAGDMRKARRTAWWYPAEEGEPSPLAEERMARVVGSGDVFNFKLGGATLYNRIEDYLIERFSKGYETVGPILDWGCGPGRLLCQFSNSKEVEVWGADVDHDNLAACQDWLPFVRCTPLPLNPPTSLPGDYFGLVVGVSVCTHLSEQNQQRWLEELRRVTRQGGVLLLSVQGESQAALNRIGPEFIRKLASENFVIMGVNPQINNLIGEDSYYLDVIQTREHIRTNWGKHFEIVEFLRGCAANQDFVVMRKPE
jgi:SAM-dependent methyltransferase